MRGGRVSFCSWQQMSSPGARCFLGVGSLGSLPHPLFYNDASSPNMAVATGITRRPLCRHEERSPFYLLSRACRRGSARKRDGEKSRQDSPLPSLGEIKRMRGQGFPLTPPLPRRGRWGIIHRCEMCLSGCLVRPRRNGAAPYARNGRWRHEAHLTNDRRCGHAEAWENKPNGGSKLLNESQWL